MESILQDLRYASRVIAKSPVFTAVIVLTLALGIGANTAVFSLLDAVFLKPVPVHDPQSLVILQWHAHKGPRYDELSSFGDCDYGNSKDYQWGCTFSSPMFDALAKSTGAFDGITGFAGPQEVHVAGIGTASIATAEIVSGEYFHTLGVPAAIGRTIEPTDDAPTASSVVVLSHSYWKRAFGGEPSILGRTIKLNNIPVTVIGVADQSFTYLSPGKRQDMWITRWSFSRIGFNEGWSRAGDPGNAWLAILARLKPGVSLAQAQAEASLIFRNEMIYGSHPLLESEAEPGVTLIPAASGLTGRRSAVATQVYLLMLAVGILLLIACANVAALLIARCAARSHEVAMRLTLGATFSRIVRQLLTESILLSALGAVTGVFFAYWGVHVFAQMVTRSSGSFPFPVTPDFRILAFTASVSVITGILFGILPARQSARINLTPSLQRTPKRLWQVVTGNWLTAGNALVMVQVALAVIVLTGAGLFLRTLRNLTAIDPGFNARNLLIFSIDPVVAGYDTNRIQILYKELQDEFASVPGVTSVSYSQFALLNGNSSSHDVTVEGHSDKVDVDLLPVGPDFLKTMRIPLLLGREFDASDFAIAIPTDKSSGPSIMPILVSEAFVRAFCGNRNPLGLHLNREAGSSSKAGVSEPKIWSREWQIVGVVKNTKYATLREDDPPIVYLPLHGGGSRFEIRTAFAPESFVPTFRKIVNQHNADLPLFDVTTQAKAIDGQVSSERLISQLSAFFGLIALLLASTGLYGLLSYQVTTRTSEIGIRKALGAQRTNVSRLILGRGIALTLIGAVSGIVISMWATRYIRSLLFGLDPVDLSTLAGVAMLLLLVALVACYIPARKAMRVDPMVALRHQ